MSGKLNFFRNDEKQIGCYAHDEAGKATFAPVSFPPAMKGKEAELHAYFDANPDACQPSENRNLGRLKILDDGEGGFYANIPGLGRQPIEVSPEIRAKLAKRTATTDADEAFEAEKKAAMAAAILDLSDPMKWGANALEELQEREAESLRQWESRGEGWWRSYGYKERWGVAPTDNPTYMAAFKKYAEQREWQFQRELADAEILAAQGAASRGRAPAGMDISTAVRAIELGDDTWNDQRRAELVKAWNYERQLRTFHGCQEDNPAMLEFREARDRFVRTTLIVETKNGFPMNLNIPTSGTNMADLSSHLTARAEF